MDQPRALTPMVPAGQWQAVKDTLSRPDGRSLTTSDAFGNTTTSTTYSNYITTIICNSYTTTNDTVISLPRYYITILLIQQPLCYDSRYNDQYTIMIQQLTIPYVT